LESAPFVSFVTPFYNTAEFLAECIDSVLHQTYQNWEYVLVNNSSTDGSKEIAQDYAARFPGKIRLIHTESFLSQVENYNFALSRIAPTSKYCKMIQADDWLFPDCVRSMVEVAEAHPRVGIVAAYQLEGDRVALDGVPYPSEEIAGREVCRLYFLKRMYLFGTPTSLLLRSELIRARNPFYEEQYAPFEDADICFRLLRTWNFGFVHQVLTYSRVDDQSILARSRARGLLNLYRFSVVVEHGRDFLSEEEYERCLKDAERRYFLYLARCALRGRNSEFWDSHRKGLASLNYSLNRWSLGKWIPRAMLEKSWESFWGRWDRDSLIARDEEALSD
jgi:glycosyltransferase involved in cell wall biosynthesis